MRQRAVQKISLINKKVLGFRKYFPKVSGIRDLRSYTFDSVPIEFHYDRQARNIRLLLGIELERLLGVSRRLSLKESILVLYEITIELMARDYPGFRFGFAESFYFNSGEGYGDELVIEKILPRKKYARLKKMGLYIPSKGYVIHFKHVEFLCLVEKLKHVRVRLYERRGVPSVIYRGSLVQSVLRSEGSSDNSVSLFDADLETKMFKREKESVEGTS